MKTTAVCSVFVLLLGLAGAPAQETPTAARTALRTQDSRFTLNGKPVFLYGISYYGALGAPEEFIRRDLDDMERHGFNWIRVWATWAAFSNNVAAVEADGSPREPFLTRLKNLVAECDRRGMVVDVTLSRGNGVTGPPRLQTHESHRRAVETIVTALKPWQNWYLDLSNERNIKDQRFTSFKELGELRELGRTLDPLRLVTASQAGDIALDELREYLFTVRVDFLCPHRPRDASAARQTREKSAEYLTMLNQLGRVVPLHYQEPFRRGFAQWQPRAEDFVADLTGARAGGAAGWCLHNGDNRAAPDGQPRRSFDLRERRLFEQLDAEESKALDRLAKEAGVSAAGDTLHSFKKHHLEEFYWSEGAMLGDLNKDGKPDAVFGPYWWEGPDFAKRHEIYAPQTRFEIKDADGAEKTLPGFEGGFGRKNAYSTDNFFAFIHDFNGDGWNDVLTYGLPHTPAYLYLNPAGGPQHWSRHTVLDYVDNESPTFLDLTGDGKPEMVCIYEGNFGYAEPDWQNPTAKWRFTPISEKGGWQRFTHGLGVGDMNGDGRLDVLFKDGWFEQPASRAGGPVWKRHEYFFAPASAQMFAYDVNGDGLADVVTALAAHGYGFAWYEQLREKNANGTPRFKAHIFMNKEPRENRYGVTFSEIHAVELVDVDGDGLKDIVTGKCFWAHGPTGAPESHAPAVLYWFKLVRHQDGTVDWVPNLIDDNSGVGRQVGLGDVNGDGRPDIIIGNKKGAFVFVNEARNVTREEWENAQPKIQFPDAGKLALSARDVIVHTPRAGDVAKAAVNTNAEPPLPGHGVLPAGPAGQPLNTDFETGDLRDWTAKGSAFARQPILGDTVAARRAPMKSGHVGRHWIGTFENALGDGVTGTLTSKPFRITKPWAAFLLAAGPYETTRVELVDAADQTVIFKISGHDMRRLARSDKSTETLAPVVVDLQAYQGREVVIRLVDEQAGGAWGHLNFDDFRFYAQKPEPANALFPKP